MTAAFHFPPATAEDWRKRVESSLKGKPFSSLVSKTLEGLELQPLYPAFEGEAPRALRAQAGAWAVSQRIDHPDVGEAHAQALADLEGGATALTMVLNGSPAARGYGVAVSTVADLEALLDGIRLDLATLRVDAGHAGRRMAGLLAAYVEKHALDAAQMRFDFGCDAIGAFARTGLLALPPAGIGRACADLLRGLRARGFTSSMFLADGRIVHEAGGGEAQELGFVLASAVETMRLMTQAGVSVDETRGATAFLLAADADEFLTLSKFRTLRLLWARIEEACGLDPSPPRVHAETAWRMMTKRDAHVNVLRTTVAIASAGFGEADAITALPFTQALGLPDAQARRLSRNAQLVLMEESNLARVADPAAGAGAFEALTQELCEAAWKVFQDIESKGGLIAALTAGDVQQAIAPIAAARAIAVARRKLPLTGTSEFPNLAEAVPPVLSAAPALPAKRVRAVALPDAADGSALAAMVAAARDGASLADLAGPPVNSAFSCAPLPCHRDAEPFEALRDAADAAPQRPQIFLALLGTPAAFTARAMFARNLFEAGGIAAIGHEGAPDAFMAATAFKESGARIACICSSDAVYAEHAEATAHALKDACAEKIWLAGRPGDSEAALRATGIGAFIFAGCDVLAALREAHTSLGITGAST